MFVNVFNSRTKVGIPPRPISQSNPTLTALQPGREAFVKNKKEWVFGERAGLKAQARAAGKLLWTITLGAFLCSLAWRCAAFIKTGRGTTCSQ